MHSLFNAIICGSKQDSWFKLSPPTVFDYHSCLCDRALVIISAKRMKSGTPQGLMILQCCTLTSKLPKYYLKKLSSLLHSNTVKPNVPLIYKFIQWIMSSSFEQLGPEVECGWVFHLESFKQWPKILLIDPFIIMHLSIETSPPPPPPTPGLCGGFLWYLKSWLARGSGGFLRIC